MRKDRDEGYTLTEMLVVIGIIGLIASVLTPILMGQMTRARVKATELQLKSVAAAVELFRDDVGRLPAPNEGLNVLVTAPPGTDSWVGPYLPDAASIKDPWGQPIEYLPTAKGRQFQLRSLGADSEPGGKEVNRDLLYPPVVK